MTRHLGSLLLLAAVILLGGCKDSRQDEIPTQIEKPNNNEPQPMGGRPAKPGEAPPTPPRGVSQ
jgi:hypothetical protein